MSKEQISELEAHISQLETLSKSAREQAQCNGFKIPYNPSFPQMTLNETDKKRVETLIEYYDEVIGMDPENGNYYASRAAAHMDLRNWNAAKTDLGMVVKLRPDMPHRDICTNFYLGIIDLYLGNTYSGLQYLATTVRQSEHQQVVPPHGWQAFSDDQIIELKRLIWKNTKENRRSESIRQLSAKVKLDPCSTKEEKDLFASIFETKAPCNTLEVPEFLNCPMGLTMMDKPMINNIGKSYEYDKIKDFIDSKGGCQIADPLTNEMTWAFSLNTALRDMIEWFKSENGWV